VLAGPLRRQVGEASNADAMRQPAIDGRLDEIGRQEGQRDCRVDLSRAALFPLGDAVRTCCWVSDELRRPRAIAARPAMSLALTIAPLLGLGLLAPPFDPTK
jgi:hypothetical protein